MSVSPTRWKTLETSLLNVHHCIMGAYLVQQDVMELDDVLDLQESTREHLPSSV
jgi:hypothetical protein